MNKYLLTFAFAFILFFASSKGLLASEGSEICSKVDAKLTQKIESLRESKRLRVVFWRSRLEKWTKMIEVANEWGLSTAKFESSIKLAEEKYNAHSVAIDTMVSKMSAMRGQDCTADGFKKQVAEVRAYHKDAVVGSFGSFKNYLKDTIKSDLKILLESAKNKKLVNK